MQRPHAPSLGLIVATSGLASLGAEIATARLLAPAFGSSTIIWANTIAIVLVALAIGAWFGGKLADNGPRPARMHQLLLGGAALLALTPVLAVPLLGAGVRALDDVSAPGFFGSLVAVLLLVAAPLALLGAVTPYAVRLALGAIDDGGEDALARAGTVAGRLSAMATGGSLVGTFLASLALIPFAGTRRTFLIFALVLAALAVWGLASARADDDPAAARTAAPDDAEPAPAGTTSDTRPRGAVATPAAAHTHAFSRRAVGLAALVPLAIATLVALPTPVVKAAEGDDRLLEERETSEQYARVLQSTDGSRTMELGEGHAIHSLYQPGTLVTRNYWDELVSLPRLAGHAPKRVLILGNAGGTTATALRALDPQVQVDAVDYDGQLAELGAKWFGLGGPRLDLLTGDARVVLRRASQHYDAILVDAYRQPYIPFHLSTREFFTLVREHLTPGGVVVVNVGHPERDEALEKVLAATMRAAGFPHVLRDPAQVVNTQLVGRTVPFDTTDLEAAAAQLEADAATPPPAPTDSTTAGLTPAQLADDRRSLAGFTRATAARLAPALTGGRVYTDDTAPVELLIDGSIAKFATGG